MVWHRDSMGVLIQRFFFSLIIMSSMWTFIKCADDTDHRKECLVKTEIPLIFILVIVTIKVGLLSFPLSGFQPQIIKIQFLIILVPVGFQIITNH